VTLGRQGPSSDLAVETHGLTRRFGKVCAVDHLDLQVRRGERIVRMAGQHSFEVLDGCVVVEVVKPLERNLVLRISGAECGLAESVGGRAQASQAHQNCKVENRAKPGRGESHGSLVYRVSITATGNQVGYFGRRLYPSQCEFRSPQGNSCQNQP